MGYNFPSAPTLGQTYQGFTWDGEKWDVIIDNSALNTTVNCGVLTFVSATQLKFAPYNGDRIRIAGTIYAIPSAGIAGLTNGGLSANTTYYVYAFNSAGTITGEFSTTGHAVSATAGNIGTEIKSGDNTRTLIGMARTNASSQFVDAAATRYIVNWFNRRNLGAVGTSSGVAATNSTTYVELGSASRAGFLTWGEEAIAIGIIGAAYISAAGGTAYINIGLDGATATHAALIATVTAVNDWTPRGGSYILSLSEGMHFITPIARTTVGTTTITADVAVSAMIRG